MTGSQAQTILNVITTSAILAWILLFLTKMITQRFGMQISQCFQFSLVYTLCIYLALKPLRCFLTLPKLGYLKGLFSVAWRGPAPRVSMQYTHRSPFFR